MYIFSSFLTYFHSFFLQQSATQDILDKFDTSPLYFTRTRGLFRECFPGEKTNAPNDGVIGKYLYRISNNLSFFAHPIQQPIPKLRIWIFRNFLTNEKKFYKSCLVIIKRIWLVKKFLEPQDFEIGIGSGEEHISLWISICDVFW